MIVSSELPNEICTLYDTIIKLFFSPKHQQAYTNEALISIKS